MNLFAHPVSQCSIHQLIPLNRALAFERLGHNDGIEMLTVAFDFEMHAVKSGCDIAFYKFWSGQHGLPLRCLMMVPASMTQLVAGFQQVYGQPGKQQKEDDHDDKAAQGIDDGLSCDTACQNGGSE